MPTPVAQLALVPDLHSQSDHAGLLLDAGLQLALDAASAAAAATNESPRLPPSHSPPPTPPPHFQPPPSPAAPPSPSISPPQQPFLAFLPRTAPWLHQEGSYIEEHPGFIAAIIALLSLPVVMSIVCFA